MMIKRNWLWLILLWFLFAACKTENDRLVANSVPTINAPITYVVITVIATASVPALATPVVTPTSRPQLPPTFTPITLRATPFPPATKLAVLPREMPVPEPQPTPTAITPLPTAPSSPTAVQIAVNLLPTNTPHPPTATPVAVPIATTTISLPPPPVSAASPQIYETTVTIPTYGYEAGFLPTGPEDDIYPYPRLGFDLVSPPVPRTYQAVVLENGYVSITVLPELGGRIYRWVDKATRRKLLYENPVIKPTSWGYRGWWLAAGGIEWAFPVEEHGLNEWRPWSYHIGSTAYGSSITVSNVEDRTGMEVGATISLDSGHAYLVIQPWVKNNTGEAHAYQLWLNAMLSINNNTVSSQTQLIVPASEVVIHSTGDGGVPGSGSSMSWPFYGGRDMSWYSNWQGWLGFFAPGVTQGFVGVYDHAIDQGIVRAYNPGWPAGTKFFGPGTLSPSLWTDDNSNYLELWSGATGSFWAHATLNPGDSFGWTEFWYPIHGMGGIHYANRAAALKLVDTGSGAEVGVAVSGSVTGQVTLWAGGQQVANWPMTIYPGQTFRSSWIRPADMAGALGLRLEEMDGSIVAQTGLVP